MIHQHETKMPRPSYYNMNKTIWPDLNDTTESDMETNIDVEKLPPLTNSKGGQWVIRLRKNQIDRGVENAVWHVVTNSYMAMLGEQFLVGDEICGVVLTTKTPPQRKSK
ncbi:hypothetical protein DOY81_011643 [Sarcophaga bullata]|nr:hypothetical protein DOY81_011643 [Sarcophaga bullata]